VTGGKVDPATLALRAPPPTVTRLSRRTIVVIIGTVCAALFGVSLWSLHKDPRVRDVPTELHNVDRVSRAEGLDQLPTDYSKVAPRISGVKPPPPVLGPPLPGDLGEAMLRAQRQGNDVPGLSSPALRSDPAADAARMERLARAREVEDALKAPLFFRGNEGKSARTAAATVSANERLAVGADAPMYVPAAMGASRANDREAKRAFLTREADPAVTSRARLQMPAARDALMAGTIIPAALLTGISSDLPGQVLATVTESVYDTATGQRVLIPQGARLIGEYDNQVAFGQRRVLLVWNRLIFPDATSLTLDRLPGVDETGRAGLSDGVDRHWRELLAGAALSTLIGVGAELAAPDRIAGQGQVLIAARQSVQESVNQVGQTLTRKSVDLQPTLDIRPGFPVRVIVAKDLVLPRYQPLFVHTDSSP
jgi:type IV secretory pathway VirB10-like protein